MTIALLRLMKKRFVEQRDDYLRLRSEERRTIEEMNKVLERLELIGKLLQLEGEKVQLPELAERRIRKWRKSA